MYFYTISSSYHFRDCCLLLYEKRLNNGKIISLVWFATKLVMRGSLIQLEKKWSSERQPRSDWQGPVWSGNITLNLISLQSGTDSKTKY